MNEYQDITPISRGEAEMLLSRGSPEELALTLVRLAYHEPDWMWVQENCIRLSFHPSKWVRRTCATCFGHLARIHGRIDKEKVIPVLSRLLRDPEVKGEAEDVLEELKVFLEK